MNVKAVSIGKVFGFTYDLLGNKKSSGKMLPVDVGVFDLSKDVMIHIKGEK
jgi:hypothetical protein